MQLGEHHLALQQPRLIPWPLTGSTVAGVSATANLADLACSKRIHHVSHPSLEHCGQLCPISLASN